MIRQWRGTPRLSPMKSDFHVYGTPVHIVSISNQHAISSHLKSLGLVNDGNGGSH